MAPPPKTRSDARKYICHVVGFFSLFPRTWLGVVHARRPELQNEMCQMMVSAVALFNEGVNRLRRPSLCLFENGNEFCPLTEVSFGVGGPQSVDEARRNHRHFTHVPSE
jgi:hypothetical protein